MRLQDTDAPQEATGAAIYTRDRPLYTSLIHWIEAITIGGVVLHDVSGEAP